MSALRVGQGRCACTARLLIKPVQAVIELGAAPDVLSRTLHAVHHANRQGDPDDFIAVALPQMHMGRNAMLPGHEVELLGSEACLSAFLAIDGLRSLVRRGMLIEIEIGPTWSEPGMSGAAYVRDRACEKYTPGWIRRSQARAERRGKPVGAPVKPRAHDPTALPLRCGDLILHVREVPGEVGDGPVLVSTYGFSSAGSPAVLPVLPDSMRTELDAA